MKYKHIFILIFFLLFISFENTLLARDYIQKTKWGIIDWSNGVIETEAISQPPSGVSDPARARALSLSMALKESKYRIISLFKGIPINSKLTIGTLMKQDNNVSKDVIRIIKSLGVQQVEYLADNSLRVNLSLRLKGPLLDLILPKEIKNVDIIHKCKSETEHPNKPITGIVLDCRGINFKPSLVPMIYSEQGEQIYGPASISREHAVKSGIVGYVRGCDTEQIRLRAGANPLVIKGINLKKNDPFDIIISNDDALKIKSIPESVIVFNHCRVVICMD